MQATATYRQVSDALATLTQYQSDTCDYELVLAENKKLTAENEKMKELIKMLRCDAVMALNGEWEINDEGFQAQIEQIDAVVEFKEECVCVGCGSSDVKFTQCGGEDGVNMCEECFT